MKLSNKQRDIIYVCVFALNGALVAAEAHGMVPPSYTQGTALLSFLLAGAMKQFGIDDEPPVAK